MVASGADAANAFAFVRKRHEKRLAAGIRERWNRRLDPRAISVGLDDSRAFAMKARAPKAGASSRRSHRRR